MNKMRAALTAIAALAALAAMEPAAACTPQQDDQDGCACLNGALCPWGPGEGAVWKDAVWNRHMAAVVENWPGSEPRL